MVNNDSTRVDEIWQRLKQSVKCVTPVHNTAQPATAKIHRPASADADQRPAPRRAAPAQSLLDNVRAVMDADDPDALQSLCATLAATPPLPTTCTSLIALVAPLTSHPKRRVRAAAVAAVSTLVLAGGHEMLLPLTGFRDPNTLPLR